MQARIYCNPRLTSTPMNLAQWSIIQNGAKIVSHIGKGSNASIVACYSNARPAVMLPLLIQMNHNNPSIAVIVHSDAAARRYAKELEETATDTIHAQCFLQWDTPPIEAKYAYFTPESFLQAFGQQQELPYTHIIVLDTHERSIWGETVLTVLKKVYKGPVIMSCPPLPKAIEYLQSFYTEAPVIALKDIEVADMHYLDVPSSNLVQTAIDTALDINKLEGEGHIIMFLSTRDGVLAVIHGINDRLQSERKGGDVSVVPFFKAMKREEMEELYSALEKKGARTIIVATAIAQDYTSLPPGIKFVIDSGLQTSKEGKSIWATKQDCEIRSNRVSSIGGKVYRLFTQETFESLLDVPPAEMSVSSLDQVVLYWLSLGVQNVLTLDSPTKLSKRLLASALTSLHYAGLVSKDGKLTTAAQGVSSVVICYPFIPTRFIAAIGHSLTESCQSLILSIVSMELAGGLNEAYYTPKEKVKREEARNIQELFEVEEGPYITLLNIYDSACSPKLKPTRWFAEHFLNYQMIKVAYNIRRELSSVVGVRNTSADNDEQMASCLQILNRYID